MKNDDPALLAAQAAAEPATPPDVFQQLGAITRQLHDALTQLGVMPKLQLAAGGLPDAKSRLGYIAKKTGEAADKVLNSVDRAKAEHAALAEQARRIARAIVADPAQAVASGAVIDFVAAVERATERIDRHLTDIMLAQDFHDLTGQVVAKVVALAGDLEDSLVKLLLQAAPGDAGHKADASVAATPLRGPLVEAAGRTDVVANQGEVDDLLASLGF